MYRVKESQLKLIEVVSVEHSVKTKHVAEDKKVDLRNSNINLDFSKETKVENPDYFRICLSIVISPPRNKSGYLIKLETQGYFFIKDIEECDIAVGLSKSALAMVISYVRAYIKTLTYNCRWGKYVLPAIDLPDVVERKMEFLSDGNETAKIEEK